VYVLLAGWFSLDTAEVTAGDLLSLRTVERWLTTAGVPHRLAMAANFRAGAEVDWCAVDPDEVSHVAFVCGPAAGDQIEALLDGFPAARRVLVGVSVVEGTSRLSADTVIARDKSGSSAPDLSLGTPTVAVPVVAVIRSHEQPEYGDRQHHEAAHLLIDRLLLATDVAAVAIDTRLHPSDPVLCSTPGQLESALARFDAVITTRLHGLVLALKAGVPAVAVDPIAGGAKVMAQAAALRWPAAVPVDDADAAGLAGLLGWCLTPEARRVARQCAAETSSRLAADGARLVAALQTPPLPAPTVRDRSRRR
jgi:hypothetical protein